MGSQPLIQRQPSAPSLPPAPPPRDTTAPGTDPDADARASQAEYAKYLANLAQKYDGSITSNNVGADGTAVSAAQAKVAAAQAAYDQALAAANASTAGATSPTGSINGPVVRGLPPGAPPAVGPVGAPPAVPPDGAPPAAPGSSQILTDPRLPQLNAARDAAKAALDAANAELATAQTTRDPGIFSQPGTRVDAPADVTAQTVAPSSLDFNAGLVAQQIGPQQQVQAQSVGPVAGVSAQHIATPGGVTAGTVTAERIAESAIDPRSISDISLSGTVGRNAQLTALQQLQQAAEGKVPSAAEWLMQKGIDENVGTAMGLAASLQGRNAGQALRSGQVAAKDAIAKSAADMAALRAREQADARTAFATLGTAISETDYKALASNQTKSLTVAVTNLQAKIDVLKTNAANALAAGQSNQAASLQAAIATMTAQVEVAKANASNALAADTSTMIARLDASKADAANALTASIQNQQSELTRLMANQRAELEAGRANQADALAAEIQRTQQSLQASMANQSAMLDAAKATASNALTAGTESAKLQQLNQQFNASQQLDVNKTNANLDFETQRANEAIRMALLGMGSSALGTSAGVQNGAPPPDDPLWLDLTKAGLIVGGTVLGGVLGGPPGAVAGGTAGAGAAKAI